MFPPACGMFRLVTNQSTFLHTLQLYPRHRPHNPYPTPPRRIRSNNKRETETDRHRQRETETQRERDRDRQRDTERQKQRQRHRDTETQSERERGTERGGGERDCFSLCFFPRKVGMGLGEDTASEDPYQRYSSLQRSLVGPWGRFGGLRLSLCAQDSSSCMTVMKIRQPMCKADKCNQQNPAAVTGLEVVAVINISKASCFTWWWA